jgi:hypothetical protein
MGETSYHKKSNGRRRSVAYRLPQLIYDPARKTVQANAGDFARHSTRT